MAPFTYQWQNAEETMAELFGQRWSRAELERRIGHVSQLGGVRLLTSDNGPSRGVRLIEFRTGTGFTFEVALDRGMDVGRAAPGAISSAPASTSGKPMLK